MTENITFSIIRAATFAEGRSEFSGVGHLQNKECNRLEAIILELDKMGIKAYFLKDTLYVEGNKKQSMEPK